MREFDKWVRIALRHHVFDKKKPSAGWLFFYGFASSHDIGVADHNFIFVEERS
jgi:hypothetical protein